MAFPKFHGITIANNAWIENATVERLASDPTPLTAGRIWYNTTTKELKFSSLDGGGAVNVQVVATGAQVAQVVSDLGDLDDRVVAVEGAYVKKDGSVAFTGDVDFGTKKATNLATGVANSDGVNVGQLNSAISALGNAFNYVGVVEGGAGAGSALDLETLTTKTAGSYYKVTTAGYFQVGAGAAFFANVNDGLVFNTTAGVDVVDNTNSSVAGTSGYIAVTGASDTGFVVDIDTAFRTAVSTNTSDIADEIQRATDTEGALASLSTTAKGNLVAAINEVSAAVGTEAGRAAGVEGTLASLTTTDKSNLVAAINESSGAVVTETNRAKAAEGTLGDLTTTAKGNLVAAVNEVSAAVVTEKTRAETVEGTLASLTTTAKGNLVSAINEVSTAVGTEKTRAEGVEGTLASLSTTAKGNLVAAVNEVFTAVGTEKTRAEGVEGTLGDLTTTAKGNLVAAINEVKAAAGGGTDALRVKINDQRFTYQSPAPALSHVIEHNLTSGFTAVQVWVKGDDNVYRNDIVAVEETDSDTTTVTPTESRNVKVTIQSLDDIAA